MSSQGRFLFTAVLLSAPTNFILNVTTSTELCSMFVSIFTLIFSSLTLAYTFIGILHIFLTMHNK